MILAENDLILHIARRQIDDERRAELRSLARQDLDWDYLFVTAQAHGLLPLLHKHLSNAAGDIVPGHFLARLKREAVANSQAVMHLIASQLRISQFLTEVGVRMVSFKGPLLAQMAYGDISLRQAGDIDILIRRQQFVEAKHGLEALGYQMVPPLTQAQLASHLANHCEIQFMRDEWYTVVDLHWDLTASTFVFGLKADEVMSRLQTVHLAAGKMVQTFDSEDLVLYQAMHGAKHLWRRLEWISSLAESLRATPAISWDTLVQRAERAHATRMLALGLRLVETFSDVPLPSEVLAAVDSDQAMKRMAQRVHEEIFTISGSVDSTETNLYNLRIMDRKRDALLSTLRSIFVPTLSDWEAVTFPSSLHPLYYAYRPLRLSKLYCASLWLKLRNPGSREPNV